MEISFFKKYKKLSAPIKATFWFLICGFLQKGIVMITTPIFTRLLSTSQYGQYSIYNSWYGIISIFATLNLSYGVFMQGLVKFEDDRENFTSSLMGLTIINILFTGIVYLLFSHLLNNIINLPNIFIIFMFIDIFSISTFSFWSSRQRLEFKYKKLVLITIINTILTSVISIIMVISTDKKVEARIISVVTIDLICFGYLYFLQIKKSKKLYNKEYWIYALKFNIPLIPHYLSTIILNQSDRIMISYLCGIDEAGIYSLAYSLSQIMVVFNTSILNTLNPWIYIKIKEKQYKEIEKVSYYILIIIAFLNFILVALAPEIISILAPKPYWKAIWIVPPVAISGYFMFMYSLFANFEFYYEKTQFIMKASITSAVINIIFNFIFIKKFGFIAAGYTTLFCYILYAIGHYFFMKKINKIYMNNIKIYNGLLIILITIIFFILCIMMMILYNNKILRYSILTISFIFIIRFRYKISSLLKQIKS